MRTKTPHQITLLIWKHLLQSGEKGDYVSNMVRTLDICQPSADRHLRLLKDMGIVIDRRKGLRKYFIVPEQFRINR